MTNTNIVQNIYEHLGDDVSREIFESRMAYSITHDLHYLRNIVNRVPEYKSITDTLTSSTNYLFGAGRIGHGLMNLYPDKFAGFIDNDKSKRNGGGVHSPEILQNSFTDKVYVTPLQHSNEIITQLKSYGLNESQIIDVGSVCNEVFHRQYFDLPYLPHTQDEIFVDCGGCDGGTSLDFIKWSGDFLHIYIFEPDELNLIKINKWYKTYDKHRLITIKEQGVWNKTTNLAFNSCGTGASNIKDTINENVPTVSNYFIKVTALDDALRNVPVTFIKMDIEGAELQALEGAKGIISTHKPKLAISVYHRPEDILKLPEMILSLNPTYRLYLRHYALLASETVLYAIP